MRIILSLLLMLSAQSVQAFGLQVWFFDGNPKDRLIIRNAGCPIWDATIVLDMRPTQNGILFDTVRGGPGIRDPLDITVDQGDATLGPVADGDQVLHIFVNHLRDADQITIAMDVDDSGIGDQVVVTGSEMQGAIVSITIEGETTQTTLDHASRGLLQIPAAAQACLTS
jgi:hypothetical protein